MATAMQDLDWAVQQARRIPIPSRQEQVLLGRAIRAWQDHPDGPDGAPELIQRRGIRATDRLVSGNLRLVARIVNRYRGAGVTVDANDLMQLGSLGLHRAALKFKPDLGYSFTTYATWWVKQALQRSRRDRYSIRLPHEMTALVDKCRQIAAQMEDPDPDVVAERCSTVSNRIDREALERALRMDQMARAVSLDATVLEDASALGEVVADTSTPSPWETVSAGMDVERVERAMATLEPRERQMVEEVVIGGASFQAVASRLGLHRDSVRKAHGKALNKLKRQLLSQQAA